MQDLIQELKGKAGLTEEQAVKALGVMKEYIHSKIPPMFSGFVDSFFADSSGADSNSAHPEYDSSDFMKKAKNAANETIGKIEVFAEEAGEHIDQWAQKAEDAAKDTLDKLKNMMGEKKG